MRIRFRIAALLVLLAFSASLAEQVWAAMCVPSASGSHADMAMPGMDMAADHASGEEPDGAGEPGRSSSDAAPCPLSLVPGSACVVVALPADTTSAPAPARDPGAPVLAPLPRRDLLLASGFFRPPRA